MYLSATTTPDSTHVSIKIIETTDIHGNFFPYDFINRKNWSGSLARVATFVEEQREKYGKENVILLDNGDILQGQPTVYYYNFIDTTATHIAAQMMNFLDYDAASIGNHDIETGHNVYDRWISQCSFPILGANVIDTITSKPYLKPYTIISRNGIKIAILGMITPAVPAWLPENLWAGLRFDGMVETARKWIPVIQQEEQPDIIIGLFHSGSNNSFSTGGYAENASIKVATEVPGFDIVLMGHDHRYTKETVTDSTGKEVFAINPANNGNAVGDIDIDFTLVDGKVVAKTISTDITYIKNIIPSKKFEEKFSHERKAIEEFVSRKIGYCMHNISTRDAYFGSSAFIDYIHTLQLKLTDADISFAAPLSFDATIKEGNIHMSDMFNLYKFENMLYVMELTGEEIKNYLEMSYDLWINTMTSPEDHILKVETTEGNKIRFKNPTYNFDSAAGILYTVDVTNEKGNRVSIKSFADGKPFNHNSVYRVAINSYRGNGGGNLLTTGAGISADQLSKRIVWSTDIDLRYHLMKQIEAAGTINPQPLNHWQFIPQELVSPAIQRDKSLLF